MVDTFNSGKLSNEKLCQLVKNNFPLNSSGMIDYLKLRRPIFRKTACYGHFGREIPEFTWERTDKVGEFRKVLKKIK